MKQDYFNIAASLGSTTANDTVGETFSMSAAGTDYLQSQSKDLGRSGWQRQCLGGGYRSGEASQATG